MLLVMKRIRPASRFLLVALIAAGFASLMWSAMTVDRRGPQVQAQFICPPQRFEPSGGSFPAGTALDEVEWEIGDVLLAAIGSVSYTEDGLLIADPEGELVMRSLECAITSIEVSLRVADWTEEPVIQLGVFPDLVDELQPNETGQYILRLDDPLLGELSMAGEPVVLRSERSLVYVEELNVNAAAVASAQAAVRVLLVTQGNRVAEYHVEILPGLARGHPNQFNQWIVTVLDENRRPLDVYGIWDPRLVLRHETSNVHSELALDETTGFLFDVVIPFTSDYNGSMPREILVHDQERQLIADVDLTEGINRYCEERGQEDPTCDPTQVPLDPIVPVAALLGRWSPETPFDVRPEATTDQDILGDSRDVAACIPPEPTSPENLIEVLRGCDLLTWEVIQ